MKNLQVIIMVVFGVVAITGVFVFAGIIPTPGKSKGFRAEGQVFVWGTLDKIVMESAIEAIKTKNLKIVYQEIREESFDTELVEALASGSGPDLILLPDSYILRHKDKIIPLSFETLSERDFRDTFIQGSEIFVFQEGIVAMPFWVDPMVMYWNRSIFTSNGIVEPPRYWDEFLTLTNSLTKRDDRRNILKSTVAFGEFSNVTHAKDIISLLGIQSGNPIVKKGPPPTPVLIGEQSSGAPSMNEIFRFYTDFADPLKTVYSWNRALPESKDAFLAQDLAIYFGYASELFNLRDKNPNLDFDVSPVPQIRDYPFTSTMGKLYGFSVMKTSYYPELAFFVAQAFSTQPSVTAIVYEASVPPVRRDLLVRKPTDAYLRVFFDSALIAKSWLDPDPRKSKEIFRTAIDSILSGRATIESAVSRAQSEMGLLF